MKFIDKHRFRELLINQSDELLSRIASAELQNYTTTGKLDRRQAVAVYTIRADIGWNKFAGFTQVLSGLNSSDAEHIKIHSVNFEGKPMVFFTDSAVKNLIGYIHPLEKITGGFVLI